jgi:hypothetical protein
MIHDGKDKESGWNREQGAREYDPISSQAQSQFWLKTY